ncbi:hypothetical protein [Vibrio sp. D431a]|uniref:hypothetical protein n=1 Tax=Vibrio sp. D431a TaxID=2837388 RepID=UPI0025551887|nr:hypothetical protein [Vibrio sp. D431a]MDK9789756.1 hypothetical protein [Vibrio sp. D431a]
MKNETDAQKWRREGRLEAAEILMDKLHPESLEHETMVEWSEDGCHGDRSGAWNRENVIAFFDCDVSESLIERQAGKLARYKNKSEELFHLDSMLRKIIIENNEMLTKDGNTTLDKAAYLLGLHPDQKMNESSNSAHIIGAYSTDPKIRSQYKS